MNRIFATYAVLTFFLMAFAVPLLPAATIEETFEKTYRFDPGGEINLENTNGSVTIKTWNRDELRLVAVKKVRARTTRDAKDFLKRVRIEIDYRRDDMTISTEYPRQSSGWFGIGRRPSVTVTYTLTVPDRVDLKMDTVNGDITIERVTGLVEARSINGGINVEIARGSLDAKTTNGSIHAEVENFSIRDNCHLKTTNGRITLFLAENARADVNASTVNGSIHTDFPLTVSGKWGPKRMRGDLNGGGSYVGLHTVNGGIDFKKRK